MTDEYLTLRSACRRELKIRGSRFIADACPVTDAAAADRVLAALRQEFHDAAHHCYAYRLGVTECRSSDDGEPAGTAGRPILAAIDHKGLNWSLVVVTRYFGGVKLGTGGLARAYAGAARLSLSAAPQERRCLTDTLVITFPHADTGQVMALLAKWEARTVGTSYDELAHVTVEIRQSRTETLRQGLVEVTGGRVEMGPVKST